MFKFPKEACPVCDGHGVRLEQGDLHKSEGWVPCYHTLPDDHPKVIQYKKMTLVLGPVSHETKQGLPADKEGWNHDLSSAAVIIGDLLFGSLTAESRQEDARRARGGEIRSLYVWERQAILFLKRELARGSRPMSLWSADLARAAPPEDHPDYLK